MSVGFVIASKQMAKAKVAMIGPSGSGKTFSALRLARGLTGNGRVGVLDSENNSASLYSDKFEGWQYMVLPIAPPYTARKYLDAIDLAVREKLDCLIIDSLTHVWAGEGGLLQQKEALDSRAGSNSYTNWQQITKVHEALKSKILYSPIHMITTMRSKQEYVMEQNERGKMAPRKVGLKPIQRDDLEYEFTVVFDIGMDHQFIVSKDRTDLFDGTVAKITEQTGCEIRAWLHNEIEMVAEPTHHIPELPPAHPPVTPPAMHAVPDSKPAEDLPGPMPTLRKAEYDSMKNDRGHVSVSKIVSAMDQKDREAKKIKNHADGSERPAAPPPQAAMDPGDYMIKCGANWGMLGKKISEINESTLKAALAQADALIGKGSRDPAVIEFVMYAKKFLASVGVAV